MSGLDPLAPGAPVLVAGAGVTGKAALAALSRFGAVPTLCDDDPATLRGYADAGVATVSTSTAAEQISRYALVIASPGFSPTTPLLVTAAAAGVPIWGDVELAWRLDAAGLYGPPRRWLAVTGTNGKTTTTSMLHAMLTAGGRRSLLCGNIGDPVLDVLDEPAELLAVELSSFQLHWAPSLRPEAGVVLNIAEDHLDWHGSLAAYAAAKARVLDGRVAVVGLDDERAAALLDTAGAPVRVGFRLGEPAAGELGVRDGQLVDRAFADDLALLPVESIPVPGPVGVLDALAAAALARCVDVPPEAIAAAIASFQVGRHRAEVVAVADEHHVRRRLEGHQPPRRRGVRARLSPSRLDRRRSAQGRIGRRRGRQDGVQAGRGGAHRPRSATGCGGVIATRAGCPRPARCDRRGCWYGCDCCGFWGRCDGSETIWRRFGQDGHERGGGRGSHRGEAR